MTWAQDKGKINKKNSGAGDASPGKDEIHETVEIRRQPIDALVAIHRGSLRVGGGGCNDEGILRLVDFSHDGAVEDTRHQKGLHLFRLQIQLLRDEGQADTSVGPQQLD